MFDDYVTWPLFFSSNPAGLQTSSGWELLRSFRPSAGDIVLYGKKKMPEGRKSCNYKLQRPANLNHGLLL
jgi:hypothetical protein